jgi:predicted oxidoreductase
MTSIYTVESGTWTATATLISFAVACASTAIQGLIAHAFRHTIGDIIVTANSLGSVDHIDKLLYAESEPALNEASASESGAFEFRQRFRDSGEVASNGRYAMHPLHAAVSGTMDSSSLQMGHTTNSYKRLDARGFFHAVPSTMRV